MVDEIDDGVNGVDVMVVFSFSFIVNIDLVYVYVYRLCL